MLTSPLHEFRVGVVQGREVGRARISIQVFQEGVVQGRILPLPDLALRSGLRIDAVDVPEDNRGGGTGSLAGGQDFAVVDRPAVSFRVDLGVPNALDAIAALLHDAPGADRDVWVVLKPRARRRV